MFLRTPLGLIGYVLSKWYDEEKRRANVNSISTAKLSQIVLSVAHAFGGSKEPSRTKISDFLPFEIDEDKAEAEDITKQILTKLIRSGRIPTHVVAALNQLITPG